MMLLRSKILRIWKSWFIKFTQIQFIFILFLLSFVEKNTKALPVKNSDKDESSNRLQELDAAGMARGRRQNVLCCPQLGTPSPQMMPPLPPPIQQQCICMPTDMCCIPMPAGPPPQMQPPLPPLQPCICTPMCCMPIPPPPSPLQMSPPIQPCNCLQVTVRVQPGVICPCPPISPQQMQRAPPLPPPICICTPIQQDPCCMPPRPPSIPPPLQMNEGGQPICMCTPIQQDPCCMMAAPPMSPSIPSLPQRSICICTPFQQDACCLPPPPPPQAQMAPIRETCICTPVQQDLCCLPMQQQAPPLPPSHSSPPICICTPIQQDPCCLPPPPPQQQMAPIPPPLSIQSITIQCAPICVPPPLRPPAPLRQPPIVMQCQPMQCQQLQCQPLRCQCQPGYIQCAQKCCLRYRKVNNNNKNNDYSPLLHGDTNKSSKLGLNNPNESSGSGQLMFFNPAATNSHLSQPPIFSIPEKKASSASSASLFPTPISKRTVAEKKFSEK